MSEQITTTLNEIRRHEPCPEGWQKLLKHLGKKQAYDEPLPLLTILESNGLDDCLWTFCILPNLSPLWRHFAVDCADRVRHLMLDERSLNALVVARRHADGEATDEALSAAKAAAWEASEAAAREAEREWQTNRLHKLLANGKWTRYEKKHMKNNVNCQNASLPRNPHKQ